MRLEILGFRNEGGFNSFDKKVIIYVAYWTLDFISMIFIQPATNNLQPAQGQARQNFRKENLGGQAALALVFLIGGAVVLVGITLAFLVYNFVNSTSGFQAANRALGVALAGANDALVKLSNDRRFYVDSTLGPNCTYDTYVSGDKASVQVLWGLDYINTCTGVNMPTCDINFSSKIECRKVAVNVEASVKGRRRRIEMMASVDSVTGEVRVDSLRQKLGGWGGETYIGGEQN